MDISGRVQQPRSNKEARAILKEIERAHRTDLKTRPIIGEPFFFNLDNDLCKADDIENLR